MFKVWDFQEVGFLGCEKLGMSDVCFVRYSECGMFRIWGFWRNVGCSRVKMIWDAGCSGCWMFQM